MREKKRVIFHIDMDHFYTAVEEREHPKFRGKPVIVGADPKDGKGRGVVSTSNYEARAIGIRSGMPISRAWKLCPEAIYLKPNFPLYKKSSNAIMEIARKYADKFEQWGIDEAFLDVSRKVTDSAEAKSLARQIKTEIKEKEHLTCSIGIGPNKLVAKVASDFEKPDGLTLVNNDKVEEFLAPLPVRKLLWVGRKTEAKLKKMGVNTIGDLAQYNPVRLVEAFGVIGTQMNLMARGIDGSEVETRNEVKSISKETTFEKDIEDSEVIMQAMDELAISVAKKAEEQKLFFKTVTIKVRYENFETHTQSKTLAYQINHHKDLQKTSRGLLKAHLRINRKIRLIGIRVSNFVKGEKQKTLV